jgi:Tfp pilus assembly protein PilX
MQIDLTQDETGLLLRLVALQAAAARQRVARNTRDQRRSAALAKWQLRLQCLESIESKLRAE